MMETIDLMTAMILGLSINAIMAIIILFTARKFPPLAAQSMKCWAVGLFILAVSYAVYSGYYQTTSSLVDFIGDYSMVLGITFMAFAVSVFLKVKRLRHFQIIAMVSFLALLFSALILENSIMSIIITIISLTITITMMAKPMMTAIWQQPSSAKIIIFSINALFVMVLIYRGIDYFLSPKTAWDYNQISTADFLTILIAVVGPVTATFGFMLMHQEKAYKELARLASIDSLTKIYNRHAIELKAKDFFKLSIHHKTPISVMIIDLDRFKQINDQFGHAAGDQVLYETARIIRKIIGENNFVGRFGGEEFIVILPNYDLTRARMLAQQLLTAFREHGHGFEDKTHQITASIGVVERKPDETLFSETLRRADDAMYDAKRSGRNQAIAV